ncbi:contactin-6-like [Hydractinia symbiolongicarpus]|uniref:contactin-6-like n=1 Tax=Hydractinia symbiolongicarpus TaxID=13093 RepID=UPI0025512B47|nr:contactin-6-like [Hydractinia symbiolongicarpus]
MYSRHNITVHGANSTSFNTTGLRGDTVYNISVSVNTKFAGLFGLPIQIVTPQGTPSMSAYNFTCKAVSHSSLLLQWKHSPPAFLEGIRTKYKIYYQLWNKVVTEIDEPYKRNMELFFLKPSTTYTVWITAFTNAGEGEPTTKINCSTLETCKLIKSS